MQVREWLLILNEEKSDVIKTGILMFQEEILQTSNKSPSLLTAYLQHSPRCSELISNWGNVRWEKDRKLIESHTTLLYTILVTLGEKEDSSSWENVASSVLEKLDVLGAQLSWADKPTAVAKGLSLLNHLLTCCHSSALLKRKVLKRFDWDLPAFVKWSTRLQKDVTPVYNDILKTLVTSRDASVTIRLIQNGSLVFLFRPLENEEEGNARLALLTECVWNHPRILDRIKYEFLEAHHESILTPLISNMTHERDVSWVLQICELCLSLNSPPSNWREKLIWRMWGRLLKLLQPTKSPFHLQLLLQCVQKIPSIGTEVFTQHGYVMEPRPSFQWFRTTTLWMQVLRVTPLQEAGENELCEIMQRKELSKAVLHKNALMVHTGLLCCKSLLQRYIKSNEQSEQQPISGVASNSNAVHFHHLQSIVLPSAENIVSLLSKWKNHEMVLPLVFNVLALYWQHTPDFMNGIRFDIIKAFPWSLFFESSSLVLHTSMLVFLRALQSHQQVNFMSTAIGKDILLKLLDLCVVRKSKSKVKQFHMDKFVCQLLFATDVFTNEKEVQAYLLSLRSPALVFFMQKLEMLTKCPFLHLQQRKDNVKADGMGILTSVLLREGRPNKAVDAIFVMRILSLLLTSGDPRSLLQSWGTSSQCDGKVVKKAKMNLKSTLWAFENEMGKSIPIDLHAMQKLHHSSTKWKAEWTIALRVHHVSVATWETTKLHASVPLDCLLDAFWNSLEYSDRIHFISERIMAKEWNAADVNNGVLKMSLELYMACNEDSSCNTASWLNDALSIYVHLALQVMKDGKLEFHATTSNVVISLLWNAADIRSVSQVQSMLRLLQCWQGHGSTVPINTSLHASLLLLEAYSQPVESMLKICPTLPRRISTKMEKTILQRLQRTALKPSEQVVEIVQCMFTSLEKRENWELPVTCLINLWTYMEIDAQLDFLKGWNDRHNADIWKVIDVPSLLSLLKSCPIFIHYVETFLQDKGTPTTWSPLQALQVATLMKKTSVWVNDTILPLCEVTTMSDADLSQLLNISITNLDACTRLVTQLLALSVQWTENHLKLLLKLLAQLQKDSTTSMRIPVHVVHAQVVHLETHASCSHWENIAQLFLHYGASTTENDITALLWKAILESTFNEASCDESYRMLLLVKLWNSLTNGLNLSSEQIQTWLEQWPRWMSRDHTEKICLSHLSFAALMTTNLVITETQVQDILLPTLLPLYAPTCSAWNTAMIPLFNDHWAYIERFWHYRFGTAAMTFTPKASTTQVDVESWLYDELAGRSVTSLPLLQDMTLTWNENESLNEKVHDPRYLLRLIGHLVTNCAGLPSSRFFELRLFNYVLKALSSSSTDVRNLAYGIVSHLNEVLENKNNKTNLAISGQLHNAAPQMQLALLVFRQSLQTECEKVPNLITHFLSQAMNVLQQPWHFAYAPLNAFLLSRSALDVNDVPMFYSLFQSDSAFNFKSERRWLVDWMTHGIQTKKDIELIIKRHGISLLLVAYIAEEEDVVLQRQILEFMHKILQVMSKEEEEHAAWTSTLHGVILPWLETIVRRLHFPKNSISLLFTMISTAIKSLPSLTDQAYTTTSCIQSLLEGSLKMMIKFHVIPQEISSILEKLKWISPTDLEWILQHVQEPTILSRVVFRNVTMENPFFKQFSKELWVLLLQEMTSLVINDSDDDSDSMLSLLHVFVHLQNKVAVDREIAIFTRLVE